MRTTELQPELTGIINRVGTRLLTDPAFAKVLQRDDEQASRELILSGIEDAIVGLVMLHIQVRSRDWR